MDILALVSLLAVIHGIFSQLPDLNQCPPEDPNCHPSCISYVNKCRICRCKISDLVSGGGGFDQSSGTGFGAGIGDGYGNEFWSGSGGSISSGSSSNSGGDWSSMSGSGNSGSNLSNESYGDKTKIIVIEKDKESDLGMTFPGSTFTGRSPFQISGPGPVLAPHTYGISAFPQSQHSIPEECTNMRNVKLIGPGIPMYCVTGTILDCPSKCVMTDEYGCKSCPCAPASKIMMPVCDKVKTHEQPQKQSKCIGTALCITSCKGEARVGETGPDGCQKCTCIKKEAKTTTTTPKPKIKDITECTDFILCMIRCKNTGYEIGDRKENGCPKCRCKQNNQQTTTKAPTNLQWSMTTPKPGSNNNNGGGTTGGFGNGSGSEMGNNWLMNPDQGVSGGTECKPPMCQGGSVNPMNIGGGSLVMGGGSSGGGDSCTGPFCVDNSMMTGSGSGGMTSGSSSGGATPPKSPFMSAMGGGGSGASGPFASSLNAGGVGGGASGLGGMGMGGSMGSPFMAAAGSGSNMMQGPLSPMNPGKTTLSEIESQAYNEECFGPSCSAKSGRAHGLIGNCIVMEKCIEECDGDYVIGSEGFDGCQSCTCSR